MITLRRILLTSALGALFSAAGCGSPVVGLECRDGFERCGVACYDLQNDNAHCGACGNACGEAQQCVGGMCLHGIKLPDGKVVVDDSGLGDGGMDANMSMPDGTVRHDDGAVTFPDGALWDGGDVNPDGNVNPPNNIPDGSTVQPDGAIIEPDGAVFDPDSGGNILEDGRVVLPDGGTPGDDGGGTVITTPPPLCTGPLTSTPDCVCDLGQTKCNLTCVNTLTDHDNCGSCGHVCNPDEYCNGAAGCALVCTPPLTLCNGQCVDFSSDDNNCGSCGNVCPAAAACIYDPTTMTGACVGEAVGHIVVIGHDMSTVTRPIRQMVGNAVFLAARNPVRVLAYDADTAVASRSGVTTAIQQSSSAIGRAYTLTTADPSTLTQQLGDADVFVIETQQNASDTTLSNLGATWSTALHSFLFRGGVILLFDGEATNGGTYQILNAATSGGVPLFQSTGVMQLSQRILSLVGPADAIGASVPTEYQSAGVTVAFEGVPPTQGTIVIEDDVAQPTVPPTPATMLPVVIHTTTAH